MEVQTRAQRPKKRESLPAGGGGDFPLKLHAQGTASFGLRGAPRGHEMRHLASNVGSEAPSFGMESAARFLDVQSQESLGKNNAPNQPAVDTFADQVQEV